VVATLRVGDSAIVCSCAESHDHGLLHCSGSGADFCSDDSARAGPVCVQASNQASSSIRKDHAVVIVACWPGSLREHASFRQKCGMAVRHPSAES